MDGCERAPIGRADFQLPFPTQKELATLGPDMSIQKWSTKARSIPSNAFMARYRLVKVAYEQGAGDFSFE